MADLRVPPSMRRAWADWCSCLSLDMQMGYLKSVDTPNSSVSDMARQWCFLLCFQWSSYHCETTEWHQIKWKFQASLEHKIDLALSPTIKHLALAIGDSVPPQILLSPNANPASLPHTWLISYMIMLPHAHGITHSQNLPSSAETQRCGPGPRLLFPELDLRYLLHAAVAHSAFACVMCLPACLFCEAVSVYFLL